MKTFVASLLLSGAALVGVALTLPSDRWWWLLAAFGGALFGAGVGCVALLLVWRFAA